MEDDSRCELKCIDAIPLGHKIALADIADGDTILKYGADIGKAVTKMVKGGHVHTQNVKTKRWSDERADIPRLPARERSCRPQQPRRHPPAGRSLHRHLREGGQQHRRLPRAAAPLWAPAVRRGPRAALPHPARKSVV